MHKTNLPLPLPPTTPAMHIRAKIERWQRELAHLEETLKQLAARQTVDRAAIRLWQESPKRHQAQAKASQAWANILARRRELSVLETRIPLLRGRIATHAVPITQP